MKRLQRGILASIWISGKKEYIFVPVQTYIDLDYEKIKTLFGRVLSFFFPAFWDDGGNFKGSFHKAIFLSNSKRCFEQKPISLLAGKEKVEGEESSPFFGEKRPLFQGLANQHNGVLMKIFELSGLDLWGFELRARNPQNWETLRMKVFFIRIPTQLTNEKRKKSL